jgi:hypothetical protein
VRHRIAAVVLLALAAAPLVAGAPSAVAGQPVDGIPDHGFPDVGTNDAVDWLASSGITTGYDDGTFRPAGTLNRGQVATFLHRLAGTHWA